MRDFELYARQLSHVPQNQDELADIARRYFGASRASIERNDMPGVLGFDLPGDLTQRGQSWTEAALTRGVLDTVNARWSLGFDDVPFPGNAALADEFIKWVRQVQLPQAQYVERVLAPPPPDVAAVVERMRPRSGFSNVRWTEEEYRTIVWEWAFGRLESTIESLVERSGCSTDDAARWILAGVAPTRTAFNIRVTKSYSGPDQVVMHINPEVATPEDVRLAYRRGIRALRFPSRGERLAHFDTSYWTWGRADELTLDGLYDLWHDVHPLWRFKNIESFRVSRLSAIKRYRPGEKIRKLRRRR